MKLTRADPGLIQLNLLLPFLLFAFWMALPTYKMSYPLTVFLIEVPNSTASFTKYCFMYANMHNCINISNYNDQTYLYENIFCKQTTAGQYTCTHLIFNKFWSISRLTCEKLCDNHKTINYRIFINLLKAVFHTNTLYISTVWKY